MGDFVEQMAAAGQTAAAFAEKKWGAPTRLIAISQQTLTTTSARILLNNPRRIFWLITNTFVGTAFLGFDGSVGQQTGILIGPQGGLMSMSVDEDGEEVGREVWGVSSGSTIVAGWEIQRK